MEANPISIHLLLSHRHHRLYHLLFFRRTVVATVTPHPCAVRRWIFKTISLHAHRLHSGPFVVGLGVQWNPPAPFPSAPVATLQLCVGRRCLVFQISRSNSVPRALVRFLADPRVTFVGVRNHRADCARLQQRFGITVANGKEARELAAESARFRTPRNASMEALAKTVLGYDGVVKDARVGRSRCDAPELSVAQVQYACVDAFVAFELGRRLITIPKKVIVLGGDSDDE